MAKTLVPKSFKANIDRALHNLYQEKSTTLHPMTLIPIYYRRMFRGDRFDFGVVESILRSEPTFAPLLSNWRLQFEWYFDSDANRYGWIDNNTRLTSEEVMNRRHHTCLMNINQVDEGSNITVNDMVGNGGVMDYAGVAPGTARIFNWQSATSSQQEQFDGVLNIDFHLTYLNIIRNYHVNKQFPRVPFISTVNNDYLEYDSITLEDLDNLFMFLRSCPNGINIDTLAVRDVEFEEQATDAPEELETYYKKSVRALYNWLRSTVHHHGGIFCSEYEPDLYQNLLNKDQGLMRAIVTQQAILDDGSPGFTIEHFRLKNHLQGLYDKIFVSGGTDRDLSRTLWGIESNRDYDIPELICVHSEIIGTNLVTSSTAGESQLSNDDTYKNVPGSMAGNLNTRRGASRSQRFTAKTSGSLMCIVSLVPLVTYNENIERHLLTHNFMDEFTPDMARKGFESVPLSDYCSLPQYNADGTAAASPVLTTSVGRQVAWLREMTAVNRCHGEFSNGGENYDWLLHRTFIRTNEEGAKSIAISPYGRPTEFQYPFVAQDIFSPNFNLQVAFKCDAYRPIPRKYMPNLGY